MPKHLLAACLQVVEQAEARPGDYAEVSLFACAGESIPTPPAALQKCGSKHLTVYLIVFL
jgi:hypothetical protein